MKGEKGVQGEKGDRGPLGLPVSIQEASSTCKQQAKLVSAVRRSLNGRCTRGFDMQSERKMIYK